MWIKMLYFAVCHDFWGDYCVQSYSTLVLLIIILQSMYSCCFTIITLLFKFQFAVFFVQNLLQCS